MYDADACDAVVGSSLQLMTYVYTELTVSLWWYACGLDCEWSNL